MKEYFQIKQFKKELIIKKIKKVLLKRKEIVFGFIFGSFLDSPSFRDIDVGVYLQGVKKGKFFAYELELSQEIAAYSGLPFDFFEIKVLNFAPLPFLSNIFSQGRLLFTRDEKLLSEMMENVSLEMLANENISSQSLKELIPT